jgi:hypothetical protein
VKASAVFAGGLAAHLLGGRRRVAERVADGGLDLGASAQFSSF